MRRPEIVVAAARRGGRGRPARVRKEKELLELLSAALSEEEIRRVLACALIALDGPGLERLVASLGEETGQTLRRLLASRGKGDKRLRPAPGAAKVRQEWERCWNEWDGCVMESGDAEGRYVIQEHHWETPYLDATALAGDIEPIAKRMRPLLGRVFEEDLDPDFSFVEALRGMDEEIGEGLPEWLEGGLDEGCPMGREATGRLLEWEWLATRRDRTGAFEFADRLCRLEMETGNLSLEEDTVRKFLLGLEGPEQELIRQGITKHRGAGHWANALGSVRSVWFAIYQELCRRGDPARYLESCRKNISKDWRLALPVVRELVARKAYQEALSLIEEAVRALVRAREGTEGWDPTGTLLVRQLGAWILEREVAQVKRLLGSWRKAARGAGQEETASALELQQTLLREWADGDAVLETFREVRTPGLAPMRDRLFADWRGMIVEETLGRHWGEPEPPGPTWVHALVDAARAQGGKGPTASFRRAVRHWLEEIERTGTTLRESLGAIGTLTLDLDTGSRLRKTSRTLHRLLSGRCGEGQGALRGSRRRWLKRLDGASLLVEVIRFWKRNAARLVPDPAGSVGSSYNDCADWLAALRELNPRSYEEVVREWAVTHRRRRNLWQAVKKRGLPFGVGRP